MKDRTFRTLLALMIAVGLLVTLAHFAYAVYAYQHCSIIEFIARELW